MKLIKSKNRVQKHGEVFTPDWIKRGDEVSQRQFTFKSLIESDNSNQYQSTEFIKINKVYKLKIEKV